MKNKKRTKILLLVLACMVLSAFGQEKTISGTEETDYAVGGEAFADDQKAANEQQEIDEEDAVSRNGDEQIESPEETFTSGRRIEIIPAKKGRYSEKGKQRWKNAHC